MIIYVQNKIQFCKAHDNSNKSSSEILINFKICDFSEPEGDRSPKYIMWKSLEHLNSLRNVNEMWLTLSPPQGLTVLGVCLIEWVNCLQSN